MSESSLIVKIDGGQAQQSARALDNDLSRLKAAGDATTASFDRLSKEFGDTRVSLSAVDERAKALILSQDRLTAATKSQESAVTALTVDLRNQAEAQRVLAQAIATATERSRQQIVAQEQSAAGMQAAARSAGLFGGVVAGVATAALVKFVEPLVAAGVQIDSLEQKFKAVFKSTEEAGQQFEFARKEATRLGLDLKVTAESYGSFAAASIGTRLEGEKTRDIFSAIAEASGKLHLSTEQTNGALLAVQQIISKGTVQAEELRGQLGERLPGAFQIAARAVGVSTTELGKMLQAGTLVSDEFLPKFAAELRRTFGTDANTQIESVASNFARLKNEIFETGGALGGLLNQALSPAAGALASLLKSTREGVQNTSANLGTVGSIVGGAFSGNGLGLLQQDAFRQSPSYKAPPPAAAQGLSDADQKLLDRAREREALAGKTTALARVLYEIEKGELKNSADIVKEAFKRAAIAEDAARAAKLGATEQNKLETAQEREAKRLAEADAQRGAQADELILKAQSQREALQQQADTGERLTQAATELVRLRNGELDAIFLGRDAAKEQYAIELQGLDTLERRIAAQERSNQLARQAAADLQEGPLAAGSAQRLARRARGRGVTTTFADINAQQGEATTAENARFNKQITSLQGADESALRRDGLLKDNETVNTLIERAATEHQARLAEIEENGVQARRDLQRTYVGAATDALGNIATAAEAFGKKGFAVYKAAAIAQTVISTYQAAQQAYASLAGIPVVGPALGGAAAAAAVVAGLARVSQIRSQQYGGGREFGGPVSASRYYEIGEKGKPEIINTGGRYYLFGAQGNVIPASNGSVGSGGLQVINNAPGLILTPRQNGLTIDMVPELLDQFEDRIVNGLGDNNSRLGQTVQRRIGSPARGVIG